MIVKAINNIIESNGLIPILLIFKAYLKITELDFFNLIVKQRVTTIKRAIKEICKIQAIKKINKALRIRNSFGITYVYDLFSNDPIFIYKKKKR